MEVSLAVKNLMGEGINKIESPLIAPKPHFKSLSDYSIDKRAIKEEKRRLKEEKKRLKRLEKERKKELRKSLGYDWVRRLILMLITIIVILILFGAAFIGLYWKEIFG